MPPRGRQPTCRDISSELFQFNDFQVFPKGIKSSPLVVVGNCQPSTAAPSRGGFFALRLGPSAALDGHGRRTYGQTDLSLVMDLEWQSPDT